MVFSQFVKMLELVETELKEQNIPYTYLDGKTSLKERENLLVAPMFTGETSRNVILPQGNWYDFYTGELVGRWKFMSVQE